MPTPPTDRKLCTCDVPDPVMQADMRFSCYTCSLPRPAQLCERCQSIAVLSVPADRDLAPLRALVKKWRDEYQSAIDYDRQHGLRDRTVELGGKAIAADELEHALAELTREDGGQETIPK